MLKNLSVRNTICKWRKRKKINNTCGEPDSCNRHQQCMVLSHSALLVCIPHAWADHTFCQHFPAISSLLPLPPTSPVQNFHSPGNDPHKTPQKSVLSNPTRLDKILELALWPPPAAMPLGSPLHSAGALSPQQLGGIIFMAPRFLSILALGTFFPPNLFMWVPAIGLPPAITEKSLEFQIPDSWLYESVQDYLLTYLIQVGGSCITGGNNRRPTFERQSSFHSQQYAAGGFGKI